MKLTRMIATVLTMLLALSCVACGDAVSHSPESNSSKSFQTSISREKKAEKSLLAAIKAETVEQAAQYMETDSAEQMQKMLDNYSQYDLTVEMDYLGKADDKDVFKCEMIRVVDSSTLNTTFVFGTEMKDRYVFCEKESFLAKMKESVFCRTCNASGVIYSGGTACAICAGTGQQYIPNAYYNGWQWVGQYQACSGCAGAGYFNRRTQTCNICHGVGLILD